MRDELRNTPIMLFHSGYDFPKNTHAHALGMTVISHDIHQKRIWGCPDASSQSFRRNSVRQGPWRDDLNSVAKYVEIGLARHVLDDKKPVVRVEVPLRLSVSNVLIPDGRNSANLIDRQ